RVHEKASGTTIARSSGVRCRSVDNALSVWLDVAVTALNELLFEVNALAHQLRKTDFRLQQGQGLLAPARAVLQVLADEGAQTVPGIAARQNASRQNVQIIANRFAEQ